jgi:hypothetical protein
MTAMQVLTDLHVLGIRLEVRGDRLRYAPRSAITPDLVERMKRHKSELLTVLAPTSPSTDKANGFGGVIDPPDACPKCRTLELWKTMVGSWRCRRCDPPTKAAELREEAARLRLDCVVSTNMDDA